MNFLSQSENNPYGSAKQRKSCRLKSSISIYLTLMLVVVIALICTLIESGRVSAMNAKLRSVTYMAADSLFAEFAQPVFDRYGIMFLWMGEEELLKTFNTYVTETLDLRGSKAGMDLDLYGMQFAGSELKQAVWLTEENGAPFAEQVYEYMKIHVVDGIADILLSRTDYFRQTEKAREIMQKLNSYQESFSKVENNVAEIYETTQKIKDLSENPKTLLEEMGAILDSYDAEEGEAAQKEFSKKKEELVRTREKMERQVSDLKEQSGEYARNVKETEGLVTEMQEEIDLEEEAFDPEIYQAIRGSLNEFEDIGSQNGKTYEAITENVRETEAYLNTLKDWENQLSETGGTLNEENLEDCRQMTADYKDRFQPPELQEIGAAPSSDAGESPDIGFVKTINTQYKSGLLDLFADKISDKAVDSSDFPSVTGQQEEKENNSDKNVDKPGEKALFCEYIREHFGNYTHVREDSPLDYEMEYILAGKDSDRDNLSSVVTRLVLLRCGADLISLMTDMEKKAEVQALASAIAGSTGQVYLEKIAEFVILLVWSLAEAMMDVRMLLEGKKVAIIKQKDNWYFSLSGIQNYTGDEVSGEGDKEGLYYEEYLLILLMLQDRNDQIFRTMDMIQANMCSSEEKSFRMKDCITGVSIEAGFTAPMLFVHLSGAGSTEESGSSSYRFQFLQEYAY